MSRQALRSNGQLLADLVVWIPKKDNMNIFGAPWQADAQIDGLLVQQVPVDGGLKASSGVGSPCVCAVCVCVCRVCVPGCMCVPCNIILILIRIKYI